MRKIVRASGALAAIAAIGVGAVACGDSNNSTGTAGGDTSATVSTVATTGTTGGSATSTGQGRTGAPADGDTETSAQTPEGTEATATVTLGKPQEMAITVPGTIAAGKVKFEVTNSGAAPHEFVLLKTETKAADLPTEGGKAKETGLVDKTETLDPGASADLEVDLKAGHYVVLCNVPGHYQAGMYKDLTVT